MLYQDKNSSGLRMADKDDAKLGSGGSRRKHGTGCGYPVVLQGKMYPTRGNVRVKMMLMWSRETQA